MSWQIVTDSSGAYYHGAPTAERDRIQTWGLQPQNPQLNGIWLLEDAGFDPEFAYMQNQHRTTEPGVYMAEDPEHAYGKEDVWKIAPGYLDEQSLGTDPYWEGGRISPQAIPPEALSLHKRWEDGLHGWGRTSSEQAMYYHEMADPNCKWCYGHGSFMDFDGRDIPCAKCLRGKVTPVSDLRPVNRVWDINPRQMKEIPDRDLRTADATTTFNPSAPIDELTGYLTSMGSPTSLLNPNNPLAQGAAPSANKANPKFNPSLPGAFNNPANPELNPSLPGAANNPANPTYNPSMPGAQNNPSNPQFNSVLPTAVNNPSSQQLNPNYPGAFTNPSSPMHNPDYPNPGAIGQPPTNLPPNASFPPRAQFGKLAWEPVSPQIWSKVADYYHVAPTEDRTRIRQHGLQPSDPKWNWGPDTWETGQIPPAGVYAWPDENAAHKYREQLEGQRDQSHDIWRFPQNANHWRWDPDAEGAMFTTDPVIEPRLHQPVEEDFMWPHEDVPGMRWEERMNLQENAAKGNPWGIGKPNHVWGKVGAYYHIAPTTERARIQQHGLQPSDPARSEMWTTFRDEDNPPRGVYISPNREWAGRYLTRLEFQRGVPHDLWEVDDPGGYTYPDPDLGMNSRYVMNPITSPRLIEGPEHREYMPEYMNRQYSLPTDPWQRGSWPMSPEDGRGRAYPQNDPEAWNRMVGRKLAWHPIDDNLNLPDVGDEIDGSRVVEVDNLSPHLEDGRALSLDQAQQLAGMPVYAADIPGLEMNDSRNFPDPTEPRSPMPPAPVGCTCEEGHKLDCPVHGLDPVEPDMDHAWSVPENNPVGFPQDMPRTWSQAVSADRGIEHPAKQKKRGHYKSRYVEPAVGGDREERHEQPKDQPVNSSHVWSISRPRLRRLKRAASSVWRLIETWRILP